jgi:hypothetical protein
MRWTKNRLAIDALDMPDVWDRNGLTSSTLADDEDECKVSFNIWSPPENGHLMTGSWRGCK